ncbi:MAG: DUF2062 domain-containing protein [Alkalimonas sp.]|nr:DUF2062 domain-containing protein [Alkalimonas sp.]
MPKKTIRKYLPNPEVIRQSKLLRLFGNLLHDANLWHLNRRSARGGIAIGLFWAWMPMPFQMVPSAAGAIFFRVNLPLAVGTVWVSNPFTMPVMFYLSYLVGAVVLSSPIEPFAFEASIDWLISSMATIGKPFLLGSVLMGITSSIVGYFVIDWLWVLSIRRAQRDRRNGIKWR